MMEEPVQFSAADPADRFLRLCLRSRWEPSALKRAREFSAQSKVDWQRLCEIAAEEQLAPFLFQSIRGQGSVPAAVEQQLSQSYYATSARNILLLGELDYVLRGLKTAGVSVILLKGAALLETVYRNPALRPMEDVDLLVRPADLSTALRVLSRIGYVDARTTTRENISPAFENEIELARSGALDFGLDLHWNWIDSLYTPHRRVIPWLWEKALPTRIGRSTALTLCPEAMVLNLCVHLLMDRSRKHMLRLYDIAHVIQHSQAEIDGEELVRQAQAFDLVLVLRNVLLQVVEEWGVSIRGLGREPLQALCASPAEMQFYRWLTAPDRRGSEFYSANLAAMPNRQARLKYVWQILFPPRQYLQKLYGVRSPLLAPFLYPYRWLRGLGHAAGVTVHSARNNVFSS